MSENYNNGSPVKDLFAGVAGLILVGSGIFLLLDWSQAASGEVVGPQAGWTLFVFVVTGMALLLGKRLEDRYGK